MTESFNNAMRGWFWNALAYAVGVAVCALWFDWSLREFVAYCAIACPVYVFALGTLRMLWPTQSSQSVVKPSLTPPTPPPE
jgi:hypothetical protein